MARQRGVQVEIIVPGRHIDTTITRRASRSQWGPLLEAGAAIYEYQPTMYHCEVMVIDDCWVSVGSTNFDNRSFRLNDEANLNAIDPLFAEEQAREFHSDKQASWQVTLTDWQQRRFVSAELLPDVVPLVRTSAAAVTCCAIAARATK